MMKTSKTLLVFLLSFPTLALVSRAQITTNRSVLQKASQDRASQEADMHRVLLSLADKKGWSLTLRNKAGRLAYLMGVNSKGFPLYVTTTDNIISAATIQTNQLWTGGNTGLNLNGSSSAMKGRIAVWDEGLVRPTHVELVGRTSQVDGATDLSDHSTHVAGTMIAAGINPVAKGMAYGAQQLLTYDFNNDGSEMLAASGNGLLISNHSYANIAGWYFNDGQSRWEFWGNPGDSADYKFGQYDQIAQLWDSIAYNAPQYLIVKAAGNNRGETGPKVGDTYYRMNSSGTFYNAGARPAGISNNNGYNTIATYGCSKNILTIGAVNPIPGGYSRPSDIVGADFSSWGPASDGRIKPDVVADGVNVLSSIATADNAYDMLSGTSMATPASAGSSALLQEYYYKLHGAFMRAATLKGLLIHTADAAGPGPDYRNGWGLINMKKAASVITSDTGTAKEQQIREASLVNGTKDADVLTVVASGKMPLVATLSWTDPPASPTPDPTAVNFYDTTRKLINDLDLRITDMVSGTVYQPWILDPGNRAAAASRGDNFRDNVEKVPVDSIIPGRTYQVKVTHKSSLARGSQAFSLLISGGGGQSYCTSSSSGTGGTMISNVSFSNINNNNAGGCKSYSDFTGLGAARLPAGQGMPISISYSNCTGAASQVNIAVYIDLNNNGSFTDAGELVLANTSLLASDASTRTFTGTIAVPATAAPGSYSRMRIVAQDGTSLTMPSSCGSYGNGETQDYRVTFINPSNDVGVVALEYPTLSTCSSDSQLVAVRIRNFGNAPQMNVPVTTIVRNGGTTIASFSAICTDSIAPGADVVFSYNSSFPAVAGTTYTFISSTSLAGDPNPSNDQNTATITVNAAGPAITGEAILCAADTSQALLKANASGDDLALWYTDAATVTPVAAGNNTSTTVIPSNKTYYLGTNDLKTKAGPVGKLDFSGGAGAYFRLGGNFIRFSTNVPLTLESAKMYIAHSGQISFTLATLGGFSYANGYSYYPLYTTTVDVHATKPVPDDNSLINVPAGDNTDTGALFFLNIPIPKPGEYILIINCSSRTSAFLNYNNTNIPYPVTLPGILSISEVYIGNGNDADTATFHKKVYFPFYNMGIRLAGCPGPRTAVTATTVPAPAITRNGNVFTSSVASGNQWYRNGAILPGATGQTYTADSSGVYYVMVGDTSTGCQLISNRINYVSPNNPDYNASIGLRVSPNPNNGFFYLSFYFDTPDNTGISLINSFGQRVYQADYSGFSGQYSQTVNAGTLASGIYVLRIVHGNKTYIYRILVKRN